MPSGSGSTMNICHTVYDFDKTNIHLELQCCQWIKNSCIESLTGTQGVCLCVCGGWDPNALPSTLGWNSEMKS